MGAALLTFELKGLLRYFPFALIDNLWGLSNLSMVAALMFNNFFFTLSGIDANLGWVNNLSLFALI